VSVDNPESHGDEGVVYTYPSVRVRELGPALVPDDRERFTGAAESPPTCRGTDE
jgi:hypothetical protein